MRNCLNFNFSGEASLHQTLGQQDSWLKPKLLSWKLERNRQSPLSTAKLQHKPLPSHAKNVFLLALSLLCWICHIGSLELRFELWRHLGSVVPLQAIENASKLFWFCDWIHSPQLLTVTLVIHAFCTKFLTDTFWTPINLPSWTAGVALSAWTGLWILSVSKAPEIWCFGASCVALVGILTLMVFDALSWPAPPVPVIAKVSRPIQKQEWQWPNEEDEKSTFSFETAESKQCDISSLKINNAAKNWETASQSTFSLKKYDTLNPSGINFGKGLIKAPRFVSKSPTQSSWVAGGYWTPPASSHLFGSEFGALSRSSSQSSGFVSTASNFGGNVFEFGLNEDRFSVFSEPASKANTFIADQSTFLRARPASPTLASTPKHRGEILDTSTSSQDFIPSIKSSPKAAVATAGSVLDKKIRIDVSLHQILFLFSVGANVALSVYLIAKFML